MKNTQLTDTVVMVTPSHFGFNPQTASTNVFQHEPTLSEATIQQKAQEEFTASVEILQRHKIEVLILSSRIDSITPDAVFPNNWFSHHPDGTLVLYPMFAHNRREERQEKALTLLLQQQNIPIKKVIDLAPDEEKGNFLEGTGSMVLDRENMIAYAMGSPRTSKEEFNKWCRVMNYTGVFFHANDRNNLPIYHTNVVMSIGKEFAVVCLESVSDTKERSILETTVKKYGKKLIPITIAQVYSYCGNILQVTSQEGKEKLVMSETAYNEFTAIQKEALEKYGELIILSIPTIESIGGGSARCMLAEVFA